MLEPLTTAQESTPGLLRRAVRDAGVLATAYYAPGDEQAANDLLATGRVVSKSNSAQAVQPAAVTPSVVASGTFKGYAFDTCDAPSQSTMDAWLPTYKAVGIYISGGLRACQQPNLTPNWVATNASKGWQFLLIDVGMQAPCSSYSSKMSTVPATALAEGKTAAANAVASAQALGFAQRSAIYSDIEAYSAPTARRLQGVGAVLPERLDPGAQHPRLRRRCVRRSRLGRRRPGECLHQYGVHAAGQPVVRPLGLVAGRDEQVHPGDVLDQPPAGSPVPGQHQGDQRRSRSQHRQELGRPHRAAATGQQLQRHRGTGRGDAAVDQAGRHHRSPRSSFAVHRATPRRRCRPPVRRSTAAPRACTPSRVCRTRPATPTGSS